MSTDAAQTLRDEFKVPIQTLGGVNDQRIVASVCSYIAADSMALAGAVGLGLSSLKSEWQKMLEDPASQTDKSTC